MQVHAAIINSRGGPEVISFTEHTLTEPGFGEIQIRHTAIGLNFIDTYHRTGLYPVPLPSGLGLEAAGVIEALGDGVEDFQVGERVAYGSGPIGAYSSARNIRAKRVSKLPQSIDNDTAAAMMLKGMTARYLLRATYNVKQGDTILLHAAAGGVGLIACQWAKALGAKVIGTVGSGDKAEVAKIHGCDYTINYKSQNIVKEVMEITNGKGVPVVYDGVGKDTFEASLDCLQKRGMLVSYGNASGAVENFNLGLLATKGSLFVTRPTLMGYIENDEDLKITADDLFSVVMSGKVKIPIHQRYSLKDVKRAHRDLEARKTTGTTLLLPD